MEFNYIRIKDRHYPIIRITLEHNLNFIRTYAYIDSGAAYSVFKPRMADKLGVDMKAGELRYLTVGDGGQIPVYLHRISVKLGDRQFKAKIGFSDRLGIGFNVLGMEPFFDKFKVCFDNKKRVVSLI